MFLCQLGSSSWSAHVYVVWACIPDGFVWTDFIKDHEGNLLGPVCVSITSQYYLDLLFLVLAV